LGLVLRRDVGDCEVVLSQSINIAIPHSLTQSVAFDRVVAWLQSQNGKQTFVKVTPDETHVYHKQYKLVAKVDISVLGHDETHTLTFASLPGQFTVTSDFADSMIEAAEMAAEQVTLQSQLTKVLA